MERVEPCVVSENDNKSGATPVEPTNEELRAANRELQALAKDLQAVNSRLQGELRLQSQLIALSGAPMLVSDFDGAIVAWHLGSEELFGYSCGEAVGKNKDDLLATHVPGSSLAELRAKLSQNGQWNGIVQQKTKDGRELAVESRMQLETINGRRLVLENVRDVTARQAADEQVRVLLGEVTHRVRNTIAIIQAISRYTGRNSRSMEDFTERFEGRLSALASAHTLLVVSDWKGADLAELARVLLAPHIGGHAGRLWLQGETVTLPADLATPFSLALHELATDAVKHGSLSVPAGTVSLSWTVSAGNSQRKLKVIWQEADGPCVDDGESQSSAATLIDSVIPGAQVERRYPPEGFVCTIELALREPSRPSTG